MTAFPKYETLTLDELQHHIESILELFKGDELNDAEGMAVSDIQMAQDELFKRGYVSTVDFDKFTVTIAKDMCETCLKWIVDCKCT
jgi:hypothetical protein